MLLLVRHGETVANRRGQYLGRADLELTARGHEQAAALVAMLPRADRVVSSPLLRARRTALGFADSIEVDERWIELDYGPFDLQPVGRAPAALLERWRSDPEFAPPGVETLASLWSRVHEACDDLVEAADESVVVVVTHVGPIKAALGWALGVDATVAERLFVEDAGVSRIDIAGGERAVRWFNRFGHQPGERIEEPVGRLAPGGE